MIRKQIYLERRQQETIRRLASVHGVSEAEVIRQAVDVHGSQASLNPHLDASAWERALRIMRSTQGKNSGRRSGAHKGWNRDELYKDRLNRHGHSSR
jgi:hypothetical protein